MLANANFAIIQALCKSFKLKKCNILFTLFGFKIFSSDKVLLVVSKKV